MAVERGRDRLGGMAESNCESPMQALVWVADQWQPNSEPVGGVMQANGWFRLGM